NPTKEKIDIAVMLTWPQPPFGRQVRLGFKNSLKTSKDGTTAIVLKAAHAKNTPEAQNSEWCVAAKGGQSIKTSYVTSWNKDGDGSDIWNDFKDDGILSNAGLDNSDSACAMAVKTTLSAGESKIIPFILSWDFPVVRFDKGTEWWKKYCEYFGRDSDNSFDIAKEALNNYKDWEKKIDAWMSPVIESPKYPDWLKCAAFNELYYSQFGGCFYESGLKSGHRHEYKGLHTDDHKYFVMECREYLWAGTFDVRHYNSLIYAKLWPEIERDTLRCVADAIMYFDHKHQTPHDFGAPWGDPFFEFDAYGTRFSQWKDLHSKFIQQVWRYYYLYKDEEFLDYVWPACKATYKFMKSTDSSGNYLPDNKGSDNTYDSFGFYGTSLLCGGLWVGALEAMEEMALVKKDPVLAEVRDWLNNAGKNLDKELWNKEGGYYNMDTRGGHSKAIMSDGLNGQRYAEAYGLEDILPRERMVSHLKNVYRHCVVPLKDFNGDGIGDVGAINAVNPNGRYLGLGQSDEIWTGTSYFLAASMYHLGLKEEALNTAFGIYYPVYLEESTAYWFNAPEAWNSHGLNPRPKNPEQYQRPRAVWEFVFEIGDFYAHPVGKSRR
ncbi:MAG: GH116 family glycosyl hydrolase, partial [Candidatus Omnitrophota bacterium]|nr:GH116 family glycosyl hydrolase [Candidatus Omnitrophota bacterium]